MLRAIRCPACLALFAGAIAATASVAPAQAEDARVVITVEKEPADHGKKPFVGHRASVDVAILLDTSNSMDGLINQAKRQLWTIVQQFSRARKQGQTPVLRVALFEYGNTRLPASEGYIRQVVALTDDLDKLSAELFALTTSGGDEYCGQVIDEAVTRLDWSRENNGYKAIFIAGNEPFTQGPVDFHSACKRAIEKGIVVNTIHCGSNEEGLRGRWQLGAQLAEGEFYNIDQDRAVVHVKCPQDEIIIKLNAELNKTYLWYGAVDKRQYYAANQAAQDDNAKEAGVPALRTLTKSSDAYSNSQRDLVDAVKQDPDVLKRVKREELPAELQQLAPAEQAARVDAMAARRAEVQAKIKELGAQREAYLAGQAAEQPAGEATLGDAVVSTILKQLQAGGFEVAQPAK